MNGVADNKMDEKNDRSLESGDSSSKHRADDNESVDATSSSVDEVDSGFVTYSSSNNCTETNSTCNGQLDKGNNGTSDVTKKLEVENHASTSVKSIDKIHDRSQDFGVEAVPQNSRDNACGGNRANCEGVDNMRAKFESAVDNLTDDDLIMYTLMMSSETTLPSEVSGPSTTCRSDTPPARTQIMQLDALVTLVMAIHILLPISSTVDPGTKEEKEKKAEFTKQNIKNNRVKIIDTLDVSLFEHLLQPHLLLVTRPHESRMDKAKALLNRLALDPEEQNMRFIDIVSGLYPALVKEITGEAPTRIQMNASIHDFCEDLKKTVEERGNVPTRGRKICLQTQCIDMQMRLVKDKGIQAKDKKPDPPHELGDDGVLPEIYQGYLEGSLTKIDRKDLLLNIKPGTILLLRGRAGIGKTTTAQKLTDLWRKGKWAEKYKVAIVLNLRYLANLKYSMTLSELLTQYSVYNPSEVHPQFPLWLSNNCDQILVFLEGLDELSDLESMLRHPKNIPTRLDATARPIEWVINIILRKVLPSSCKVITSRPFTALKLLDCQRTVELLGLTRSAVKDFIKRNVPEEHQSKVQLTLESNPHLLSVCGITFYCAAICQLLAAGVDLSDEQHLNTYTRITSFLVLETPYHQTAEVSKGPYTKAQGLADVLPPLARLAKYGLLQGDQKEKLTFNPADFLHARIKSQEQNDMERSGLISSLLIKDPRSKEHQLTQFLHLAIQEILASAEILQSDEAEIENVLKRMSQTGRLSMAELFLVGLALDKESEWVAALREGVGFQKENLPNAADIVRSFCLDILKGDGNQSDCLRGVQAAYESRSAKLAKEMSEKLGQKEALTFSSTSLTSIDVNALVFVWQHIDNVCSIALTDVNLDDFSLEILQPFICSRKTIKEINLDGNQITDKGMMKLFSVELQSRFKILSLRGNPITDEGVDCISGVLGEDKSLTVMNLEETSITNNGLLSLIKAMHIRGKPICVSVSTHLNEDLRHVLVKGEVVAELTTLNLKRSGMKTIGICSLAMLLKNKAHIKKLMNLINDDSIRVLADALVENALLGLLDLSQNLITDTGAGFLAETLPCNKGLKELRLSSNPITEISLKAFTEALAMNSTRLNCLRLNLNKVEFVSSGTQPSGCPLLQLGKNWTRTVVLSARAEVSLELRQNGEAHEDLTDGSDDEQRTKQVLVTSSRGKSESTAASDSDRNSDSDGSLDSDDCSTERLNRLVVIAQTEALLP